MLASKILNHRTFDVLREISQGGKRKSIMPSTTPALLDVCWGVTPYSCYTAYDDTREDRKKCCRRDTVGNKGLAAISDGVTVSGVWQRGTRGTELADLGEE